MVKRSINALSSGPVQHRWETTTGQGDAGEHEIVALSAGHTADTCRSWPVDRQDATYLDVLDRFWPGYAKSFLRGELYDWLGDPYSRGSYSITAPDQVTVAGPFLAQGVEVVGSAFCRGKLLLRCSR